LDQGIRAFMCTKAKLMNGGKGPWGPSGGQQNQPDLEELLKRGKDRLKQVVPDGSGLPGSLMFLVVVALAGIIAFYVFTFRVDPDELGVVLYLGKPTRSEPPGLHFRLPYPIEEVRLPKVTRQNIIEIGMRTGLRTRIVVDVSEESLMLTGDENIVDIHFVVFWRIRDAQKYLFNIQSPEITVKDVAESAMRDIVGQSDIQPLLTGARQKTEQAVQKLMQDVLDSYGAGVSIDQVQLQKVDPPTQVIDAFRDVQAARADQQRLQNEAGSYASRIVPEARGEAERILQSARAYKEQTVAEATVAPTRSSWTARVGRAWCPSCHSSSCRIKSAKAGSMVVGQFEMRIGTLHVINSAPAHQSSTAATSAATMSGMDQGAPGSSFGTM
jgi:modulator of FtsH protease HflK